MDEYTLKDEITFNIEKINQSEVYIPLIIFFGILILMGLIGNKKHIGFWWTFFLSFTILPGIIALTNSENVDLKPKKGDFKHVFFGVCFMIYSIYLVWLRLEGSWDFELFPAFLIVVGLFTTGLYLIMFGCGKINRYKNTRQYWLIKNDNRFGPLQFEKILELRPENTDYIWYEGLDDWIFIKESEDFNGYIK